MNIFWLIYSIASALFGLCFMLFAGDVVAWYIKLVVFMLAGWTAWEYLKLANE